MSRRASIDPAQPVPPPDGEGGDGSPGGRAAAPVSEVPGPSAEPERPTYGFVPEDTGDKRGVKIALVVVVVVLLALLVALAALVVALVRGVGAVGSDLWETARSELAGQSAPADHGGAVASV